MYIIKNKFIAFLMSVTLFSCAAQSFVVSEKTIYGSYINAKQKVSLTVKPNKTFLLKQDLSREFCMGSWKLENEILVLYCEKPEYPTDYLTSYNLKTDTIYRFKLVNKDKLNFGNITLKKE
ncbi:hypothetical protein [Empedobacter brevis]|uniref:hypothetical protein n=1 Tax=Empedobacter brevis TaxID=247 RepID=UPI003340F1BC